MNTDKLINLIEQGNENKVFEWYWEEQLIDMIRETTGVGKKEAREMIYDMLEMGIIDRYDDKSKTIKINYEMVRKWKILR